MQWQEGATTAYNGKGPARNSQATYTAARRRRTLHQRTFKSLLARGFDTEFIKKIASYNHTIQVLRGLSRKALKASYNDAEIDLIFERIKREPIPDHIVESVISAADGVCCFCADGNQARPYQLHHVVEYSKSQENTEDNLILICPTHHQSIPKQFTPDQQKEARRKWHAVAAITKTYRAKGVDFPFGCFVGLDYTARADPAELIEGYAPSSSTALDASRHPLTLTALRRLAADHFLVIAGGSGDGKTTFAVGVAGHLWEKGALVLAYRHFEPSRPVLHEILKLLSAVDRDCVLLLDDANRYLSEPDLAQIERAVSPTSRVIATWTRELGHSERFERHLPNYFLLDWEQLRPHVTDYLLAKEAVIAPAIRKRQGPHEITRVGLGHMDERLANYLKRYMSTAKTVSDYFFMVRGGDDVVAREINNLANNDRADVPVLHAAVEQIAGFEKTVSPQEVSDHYGGREEGSRLPPINPEWVQTVFDEQCKRGLMQKIRSSYTTVHRDWAAKLIDQAFSSDRTRPEIAKLLTASVDLGSPQPNRLLRLWTWLKYHPHAGPFMTSLLAAQTEADWTNLVGKACFAGLETVGLLAGEMHLLFQRPQWNVTVAGAFSAHERRLSRLVELASPQDWYSLSRLEFALGNASPDLAVRVWQSWDPNSAATVITDTHPDLYEWLWWTIAGIKKHCPRWIAQVAQALVWDRMSAQLSLTRRGDLESVFRCKDILSMLEIPIRRSMVRRFGEALGKGLGGCRLAELRVGFRPVADPTWWFFSEDIKIESEDVSTKQLAEDLSAGTPREWRMFVELTGFAVPRLSRFCGSVLRQVQLEKLVESVKRQAEGHEYELRCLLWSVTQADEQRRKRIAAQLYPEVLAACNRSQTERPMLAKAFSYLDSDSGKRLLLEANINAVELRKADDSNSPVDMHIAITKDQLNALEQSGKDYIVDFFSGKAP